MPGRRNYRRWKPTDTIARAGVFAAILLAGACPVPGYAGEYVVTIDSEFSVLRVTACFAAPVPSGVFASFDNAPRYLTAALVDGDEARVEAGRRLSLGSGARSCIEYSVNARAAARASRFPNVGGGMPDAVLLDPGDWLWLPDPAAVPVQFVRFDLPDGMTVSAPWPAAGAGRFRIDGVMREWSSLVAIGRLISAQIQIPGAQLRFAMLGGAPPADPVFVRDWVRRGAEAVTTIYGVFPVPSPQILVAPIGRGGEAVPWGQVERGGGAAAHLFIDQTRPVTEFAGDWVLVHELSHLVHPSLGPGSAWLSEGLATYYQNVARARAGMLTEREVWRKLHEGFERGKAQTRPGIDLAEAALTMREQRAFMRVYWSGTAMALLADIALRDAGSSLDDALRRFRECCLSELREWEASEFLERLDELGGTRDLSELRLRYLHSDRFPDLGEAYRRLGLLTGGGAVDLDEAAASRALRRAIMAPRN